MRIGLAIMLALLASSAAEAATVKWMPIGQLAQTSDAIVVARVEAVSSQLDGKQRAVRTRIKLNVTQRLKGLVETGTLWLEQLGGIVGEGESRIEQRVPGQAKFRKGERVLVFLQRIAGRWVVNGLSQGKFELLGAPSSPGVLFAHRDTSHLNFVMRPAAVELEGWSLDEKGYPLSYILDLIAGKRPNREPLRLRPRTRQVYVGGGVGHD
ncbi:MAG: hypothetical protein ACON3Z_02685 [Bradymonadia bacterium]